jgi:DNA gyrase subunit A
METIKPKFIEDEMKKSYLDYAMSVIVGRALPDTKDGLKPAHRRILFAMNEMGLAPNKPFKKSARIVGEVLGKYHPHGDIAVYDTMVRMAQDFSLRYPLVKGQGNFGSIDGDSPAASRYTEAKLTPLAMEILEDIDEGTVDFMPNYDNSLKEPVTLPSKVPNLLINGSSGIAVGMATNVPPHNLKETCKALIHHIEHPEASIEELMQILPGPDFPTGAEIYGDEGLRHAYTYGKGKITVRAKMSIESKEKTRIIVDEIPYMVNKSLLIEEIAGCVKNETIREISGINDESDREGMRIVITLKKDASPEVVQNLLYNHTRLQTTFGIIFLGLVKNQPRILNLKALFETYVDHRLDVIKRRSMFRYEKAKDRIHILEGLKIALINIDEIVQLIKSSKDTASAGIALMQRFSLSDKQAKSILDMKLSKLTSLEQENLQKEMDELHVQIKELEEILASHERQLSIIKFELKELSDKYGDDRRTTITKGCFDDSSFDYEELIEEQECIVTISHQGYIKRTPSDIYRSQNRGGKGVNAGKLYEEDFMEDIFSASTHSYLLCFSNLGKVHWQKVYQIPEAGRTARGRPIINLLPLQDNEKITNLMPIREFDDSFLTFITKSGVVKKTSLKEYSNPRKGGIIALSLREDDEVVKVVKTSGEDDIIIATKNGKCIRFHESESREMGRQATGVRGITLISGDIVIGAVKVEAEKALLTVSDFGCGKRTAFEEYPKTHRGGKGVLNMNITDKNGPVIDIKTVSESEDIMLVSRDGIVIRVPVSGISIIGRNTQGVRIMKLENEDRVVSVAKIAKEEECDTSSQQPEEQKQ